jgi:hypothetical protein
MQKTKLWPKARYLVVLPVLVTAGLIFFHEAPAISVSLQTKELPKNLCPTKDPFLDS